MKTMNLQNSNYYQLTKEQMECVTAANQGSNLKIKAFAGSGKTTTLIEIAKKLGTKGLYIAFNKSIQLEATKKFPDYVDCKTAHGLAYKEIIGLIRNKIQELTIAEIADILDVDNVYGYNSMDISYLILNLLREYCNSNKLVIDDSFASHSLFNIIGTTSSSRHKIINYIIKKACEYWERIWYEGSTLPIEHDFYLKVYQLANPNLSKRYKYILFDECQDANPVLIDIVSKQRCQKIYVGDEHQQIYSWRGAINAFNNIDGESYYLSQSFRFGKKIAEKASIITEVKGETKLLHGLEFLDSEIVTNISQDYTVLCRTNARIIECIVNNAKHPIHVIGGNSEVINLAKSGFALYRHKTTQVIHRKLKQFKSWNIMKSFNKRYQDPDITFLIKIIVKHGDSFSEIIKILESTNYVSEENADIIFSTIHKAKGREWDNVLVEDDFSIFNKNIAIKQILEKEMEELNLMYVAMTRAKKKLLIKPLFESYLGELQGYIKEHN